jgi:integrase
MVKVKLSARSVATAKQGRHGDGGGLYLVVAPSGARKWVFRFSFGGKVTEAGLGGGEVALVEARDKAAEARKMVRAGINPIQAKRQALAEKVRRKTFGEVADTFLDTKESEWGSERHRNQWRSALKELAEPIRAIPIDEIDEQAVLSVLTPLWLAKPETASRLRRRIEAVLDAAKAQKLRSGDNPARWRGHLSHLLPKRGKLTYGHHPAMPYCEVPAFMSRLRGVDTLSAKALEFCILTAARSGEVLGARWSEIDLGTKVWVIPAERMKAAKEHRVPLTSRCVAILEQLACVRINEFVFFGQKPGKSLSHIVMQKVLHRLDVHDATAHGFRSSFRDWSGNETHFPREVAEAALAHSVGNAVEQAYRRSDALEKRRALMDAWAAFCGHTKAENIIPLRAGRLVEC